MAYLVSNKSDLFVSGEKKLNSDLFVYMTRDGEGDVSNYLVSAKTKAENIGGEATLSRGGYLINGSIIQKTIIYGGYHTQKPLNLKKH